MINSSDKLNKRTILVEYPSWNPYAKPTIGNIRAYVLGSFTYKLLNSSYNSEKGFIKREYLVNDSGDPTYDKRKLGIEYATVSKDILELLSEEEGLVYFHESSLYPEIERKVTSLLKQKGLLTNEEDDVIVNSQKITFKYGTKEFIRTKEGTPLYFFHDLCYGYKNRSYDKVYSFLGQDQKKHCCNLKEVEKNIETNNRIIHLYGLVYKKGGIRFSKRAGDTLPLDFQTKKEYYFLFFNNHKHTGSILDFYDQYDLWLNKNKKILANLYMVREISEKINVCKTSSCTNSTVGINILKKSLNNLEKTILTSPLVDYLFYSLQKPIRICCSNHLKVLREIYLILT